mgnify:CR=1 FL=1
METLGTIEVAKTRKVLYTCDMCDYTTSRKNDYDKHMATGRHAKLTNASFGKHKSACGIVFSHKQSLHRHKKACDVCKKATAKVAEVANCFQMFPEDQNRHECACGSTYRTRSGLWKHKKPSLHGGGNAENVVVPTVNNTEVLEVLQLLQDQMDKDSSRLKDEMEQIKSGVLTAVAEPKVVNINVFLNERCADAVPIQDFTKHLIIDVDDINYAAENGKVSGITNIIQKRFDELGVHQRPLHCTDVKRGTLYVKNTEGWEKEKGEVNQMIRDVEVAQVKGIKVWEGAHPRCFDTGNDKEKDRWFKIVKCLTNDIEGIGTRKIAKNVSEVSKINQEEML